MSLQLTRFSVSNYKSIRSLDIQSPPNLVVFVGKNNAGKSNILDVLNFLTEAEKGLQPALARRGGSFREVARGKQESSEVALAIEWQLPDDLRSKSIAALLEGRPPQFPTREVVLRSPHLRTLTYSLTIGNGRFREELRTEDIVPAVPPVVLQRTEGDAQLYSTGWSAVLYRGHGDQPQEALATTFHPSSGAGGIRLCLNMANPGQQVWLDLAALVRNELTRIRWISPVRRSDPNCQIQGQSELDPEASKLADVLHTLFTNDGDRFQEIEAEARQLVPTIGSFFTPTTLNTTTLGVREPSVRGIFYTLDQISSGTRTAIAIITRIVCAEPGTWVCVEEPEAHLHPEAQAAMSDFLRRQAEHKRIWVSTHSPVIASRAPVESVFLVSRGPDDWTRVEHISEASVDRVIQELGVRPSYNFEADALVFVEGKDDVPIYRVWARKFGLGNAVQFVDAEGWNSMDYFANAKVLQSRRVRVAPFVIFDGDTEREAKVRKIKEQLTTRLQMQPDRMLTLSVSELEGHLLDARATLRAFAQIRLLEADLEKRFAPYRGKRNQKAALDEIFQEYGVGRYDGALGARIAEEMTKIPGEVEAFFIRIRQQIGR